MRKSLSLLVLAAVAVVVLAVVYVRFGRSSSAPAPVATSGAPDSSDSVISESDHSQPPSSPPGEPADHRPTVSPTASDGLAKNWPDKVDTILASNVPEPDKVKQLLEMLPRLPEDGQEAVASHLSNLLPNEQYAELSKFLTDASVSTNALDVLMRDALNRPNSLKLPVLLEVARNPRHPKAAEAKETLTFMLEEDDGEDWAKWQAKMDEWLKANPD